MTNDRDNQQNENRLFENVKLASTVFQVSQVCTTIVHIINEIHPRLCHILFNPIAI